MDRIEDDQVRIMGALVTLGGDVSIEELAAEVADLGLSRAQIRDRLSRLMARGEVIKTGRTKATRYTASARPDDADAAAPAPGAPTSAPAGLFSSEAVTALSYLNRPIHERALAHFDLDWVVEIPPEGLLPEDLCAHLDALGGTGESRAPAGTYARQIYERLIIDLSWASSSLEGNTYTLLDTERLLSGEIPEDKDPSETQMVLNHERAIELLVEDIEHLGADSRSLRGLHATLMENLLRDPGMAGRLRNTPVTITSSTYAPLAIPQRLEEAFTVTLTRARRLDSPLRCCFFLLAFTAYLQPFIDGNERTARLACNIPLLHHNMRPLSFVDVPRDDYLRATLLMYERRDLTALRELFAWAYERSCARYPDVTSVLAPPDAFRQLHRDAIYELVARVVRAGVYPYEPFVEEHAEAAFSNEGDIVRFAGFVLADLEGLHEGNFLRYRIRPSEYDAWRALASPDDPNSPG